MPAPLPPAHAPEAWAPARRLAERVLGPLERFLHIEAASGIVLLVAALVGLAWANSPWAESYHAVWHTPIVLGIGGAVFEQPLHFWINDGLMAVFFFVVGLEIRREIHEGELSEPRKAALPIVAALGGMLVPALIFLLFNPVGEARRGFGVPTATDIAFAVGVLALLGRRVPPALRVLLLALAIIDDIGAIIIIAIFYSGGIEPTGLLLAAGGIAGVFAFQSLGIRKPVLYVLPGAVIWSGMLAAGVHPTIAGVLLGLLTPARAWYGREGFVVAAREALDEFEARGRGGAPATEELLQPLHRVRDAHREALPPVVGIQAGLHGWVAFGIMPLFALANAGVSLTGVELGAGDTGSVLLGVLAGLVVGKPLGVVLASLIAVKLGICKLPVGVNFRGITVVGLVAGIGFTMAIFIAGLAFEGPELLSAAKLAVLVSSGAAAVAGLIGGRVLLAAQPGAGAAATVEEAERSADA